MPLKQPQAPNTSNAAHDDFPRTHQQGGPSALTQRDIVVASEVDEFVQECRFSASLRLADNPTPC